MRLAASSHLGRGIVGALGAAVLALPSLAEEGIPPVPVPTENPITESKRALGKILFWDAQLSSDNSIACGSCHIEGWVDPVWGRNPGRDGRKHTTDDALGSLGMVTADQYGKLVRSEFFGFNRQVTPRQAPPPILAMFATDIFAGGRARTRFVDPETGETVIEDNGGLESQAVAPILNSIEMAYSDRTWPQVTAKIARSRPLALATDLPPDVSQTLLETASYPALFAAAFGSAEITAARIAMAIATYERTLVPDQTPYDRFLGGEERFLTEQQQDGLKDFEYSKCSVCHPSPLFTSYQFRNIGLRPIMEDEGRFNVTKNETDKGKFKVASLRQISQRNRYMHTGMYRSLEDIFDFYARRPGSRSFPENRDPLLDYPISFDGLTQANIIDFLRNGLTDPRIAARTFPFDRPTLHTELSPTNPVSVAPGLPGTGGIVPVILTPGTPNIGNDSFRFGIHDALGGAQATLSLHRTDTRAMYGYYPVYTYGPITLEGKGAGEGYGTIIWPIPDDRSMLGDAAYAVWSIDDPGGDRVRSAVLRLTFYRVDPTSCGCPGDLDCDGIVGYEDLIAVLSQWGECAGFCGGDMDDDGTVGFEDLIAILDRWGGC